MNCIRLKRLQDSLESKSLDTNRKAPGRRGGHVCRTDADRRGRSSRNGCGPGGGLGTRNWSPDLRAGG